MSKLNFRLFALLTIALFLMPISVQAAGHSSAPDGFYAPEVLAEFDGSNDEAYIAYKGRVYDVSDRFSDGSHGGTEAGQDITENLVNANHGPDVLDDNEPIGYYLDYILTEEELAEYDGSNDNKPLVAVDNILYDASDVFSDGSHGGNQAGQDLSDEFHDRHGEGNLEAMPVVGALVTYELTEEELAEYDGQDNSSAFVAVNDVIYDVSDSWSNGSHQGMEAGNDITEEITAAGHGKSVLANSPVVGVIAE